MRSAAAIQRTQVDTDIVVENDTSIQRCAERVARAVHQWHAMQMEIQAMEQDNDHLGPSKFEGREGYIGGSEVSAIVGTNPWSDSFDLFCDKVLSEPEEPSASRQRVMNMGNLLETMVLDDFIEENPDLLVEEIERQPEYDIVDSAGRFTVRTHPDARYVLRTTRGVKRMHEAHLLEIKTTSPWAMNLDSATPPGTHRNASPN